MVVWGWGLRDRHRWGEAVFGYWYVVVEARDETEERRRKEEGTDTAVNILPPAGQLLRERLVYRRIYGAENSDCEHNEH